jgi:hypothetical protein
MTECTFINTKFIDIRFGIGKFTNCVFNTCYFDARFTDCTFLSSSIINTADGCKILTNNVSVFGGITDSKFKEAAQKDSIMFKFHNMDDVFQGSLEQPKPNLEQPKLNNEFSKLSSKEWLELINRRYGTPKVVDKHYKKAHLFLSEGL